MLFPGFYLVICTSDLNSILGILFSNLDVYLIIKMLIKFYKRTPPPCIPPNFYYRSGEVTKVMKMTPKTRKSTDQRNNLIPDKTSLNWSHNKRLKELHRRFVDPKQVSTAIEELPHCRNGGKWWRKDDPWPRDFPYIYLSMKWFQDVATALFKWLAPFWIH